MTRELSIRKHVAECLLEGLTLEEIVEELRTQLHAYRDSGRSRP